MVHESTPHSPTTMSPTSTSHHIPRHSMTTRSQTGSLKPRHIFNLSATTNISPIPCSTPQAMCDPNWKFSMDVEMDALCYNHT